MKYEEAQSVRLLFDLRPCQTVGSAKRGVGRYSHALLGSLLKQEPGYDVRGIVSDDLTHEADRCGIPESHITRLPPFPSWPTDPTFLGGERDALDAIAFSATLGDLKCDILHVSHAFEGLGDRTPLPSLELRSPGQIISATLYDLIPLIFRDHYLQSDTSRKWYLHRLSWVRQVDLLLAISESSRRDAIDLLGIDPSRIVTVHGGISPNFHRPSDPLGVRRDLASRYGLRPRFVVYAGGDDHRKNLGGAISGYALVPAEHRRDCQLVIVCSMERERVDFYRTIARQVGLAEDDLVITGFVPDEDLCGFYQTCDAFVFPSLYEGLGLPVLEAMACGAPVLGGDNSSIREIIVRPDALFDAQSPAAVASALSRLLTDQDFERDLRRYGLERSGAFSWSRTARLALDAFEDALARRRVTGAQAAIQGWLPKRRLAILSPLPPCRSGIADYNAVFLPYLARYFAIDLYVDAYKVGDERLLTSFRIFDASEFEKFASNYDAILYEFGNSEFHSFMLPLLERFPGVVGLHDAFLSGLFRYVDFHLGNSGSYAAEMLAAHGPRARRYFAPGQNHSDANEAAMIELPCTKRVLDSSIGVISHSSFNLAVARAHYPEGWQAPYRIVPQMVEVPPAWTRVQREQAKEALGFKRDDFLISTFGSVAWTKWGDRLLEAFCSSNLSRNSNVHLVFAGELSNDDFGRQLEAAIASSPLQGRIRLTGYLSDRSYEHYLRISDVAVQLRTMSRGGTPKGVLDCLAFGLPVIVNDDGSYKDYPGTVVTKLPPVPAVSDIAAAIDALSSDPDTRIRLRQAGLEYVRERHDPAHCAAQYAAAIHEFSERARITKIEPIASEFAPHLARCRDATSALQSAANWLEGIPSLSFARRRLFVDVSHIAESDHGTGIPRVVKRLVGSLYCSTRAGIEPIAVQLIDGRLRIAAPWLRAQQLLLPQEFASEDHPSAPPFRAGDVLLMLDSSWARYREFAPVFVEARMARVPVCTVVYDLLPIVLPEGCIVPGGREWFEGWVRDAIEASDGLLCISRSVAEDLETYIRKLPAPIRRPPVEFWHLGSDFSAAAAPPAAGEPSVDLIGRPYLLMVGTIDPRKSHALALEAMERLWRKGHELSLCIAGKEGWLVSDLMDRLRKHPQLRKRLFLFESPSDVELTSLYRCAAGLLFLSIGEGFGLPLVEAANHGTPILCSDLPVFREVAGDFATYVDNRDPILLGRHIMAWWKASCANALPDTRKMPRITWEQSSLSLLKLVFDNTWLRSSK